ncbi:MAG: sulfatase-like hydrolase/transferase [Pirellulaceae bacterium]
MHWFIRIVGVLLVVIIAVGMFRPDALQQAKRAITGPIVAPRPEVPAEGADQVVIDEGPPAMADDVGRPADDLKNPLTRALGGMVDSLDDVFQDTGDGLADDIQQADNQLTVAKEEIRDAIREVNRQVRVREWRSPHVILVVIQGIRKSDLSPYADHHATQLIEMIAEEGTVFDWCYAGPSREIARHMLLTGNGHSEGAKRRNTLANMMWQGGYRTGLFGHVNWITPAEKLAYDRWSEIEMPGQVGHAPKTFNSSGATLKVSANNNGVPDDDIPAERLALSEATEFVLASGLRRPAFAQVHLTIDHNLSENDRAAMVAEIDRLVGRFIYRIENDERTEFLSVIITGTPPPVDRTDSHKLYEADLQVPLIVRQSGMPKGQRSDVVCGLLDLAPTLGGLTHIFQKPPMSGGSLARVANGKADNSLTGRTFRWPAGSVTAIRQGPWKAIFADPVELYYMEEDPREEHNLAGEHQDVLRKLAEQGGVDFPVMAAPAQSP